MGYPTTPFAAGQALTANAMNAVAERVAAGTVFSFSSSTSETVVGSVTIPVTDPVLNSLNAGFELRFSGVASTTSTPTVTVRVRLGTVAGTVLFASPAIATSSASNASVYLSEKMFVTLAGSSGTANFFGELDTNVSGAYVAYFSGTTGATVNTTAAVTLVVTAQFSVSAPGNLFTGSAVAISRF